MAAQPTTPTLQPSTFSASRPSLASRRRDSSSSSSDTSDKDGPNLSDEGSVQEFPLEWHDDHWDELLDYESPYIDEWSDWATSHVHWAEESVSNEKLHKNPTTRQWLQKLAGLSRSDFTTLKHAPGSFVSVKVPLFRDEDTGDEYQLPLYLSDNLVYTVCPRDPIPFNERARPLVHVMYRGSISEEPIQQDAELPRYVIPLGPLVVRTEFHHTNTPSSLGPLIELTDYQVVLDAESESMPLWILCSRRTLKERHQAFCGRNRQLPIFRGLMEYGEYGYDAACILKSVHQLGSQTSYEETCDMVRRTRAVVDPVSRNVSLEKMEELIGGPVPNNVD